MARGGKRLGAGAKPHAYSEDTKRRLAEAIEIAAKEEGTSAEDILAGILVRLKFKEGRIGIREWLAAFSMYLNTMVVKSSHQKVDIDVHEHRVVVLPEIKRPKDDEVAQA